MLVGLACVKPMEEDYCSGDAQLRPDNGGEKSASREGVVSNTRIVDVQESRGAGRRRLGVPAGGVLGIGGWDGVRLGGMGCDWGGWDWDGMWWDAR